MANKYDIDHKIPVEDELGDDTFEEDLSLMQDMESDTRPKRGKPENNSTDKPNHSSKTRRRANRTKKSDLKNHTVFSKNPEAKKLPIKYGS